MLSSTPEPHHPPSRAACRCRTRTSWPIRCGTTLEARPLATERQDARYQLPAASYRLHAAGCRLRASSYAPQGISYKFSQGPTPSTTRRAASRSVRSTTWRAASRKLPATPAARYRLQATSNRLQATSYRLQTTSDKLQAIQAYKFQARHVIQATGYKFYKLPGA